MNIENDFLTDLDLFGKVPEFYYKGKSKKSSTFGIVLTFLYIALYILFLIYKLVRMFKREDVTFYDSYVFNGIPSIELNNNDFYGGFGMGGIIDERMYWLYVTYVRQWTENGETKSVTVPLETEQCRLENFGPEYQEIFKDQHVENYYCIKDFSGMVLEGYSNLPRYSYFNVKYFPCVGNTSNGEECYNDTIKEQFFRVNKAELKFQDNDVNPLNYESPIERKMIHMNSPLFKNLFQLIYAYLQIVNIETDEDITGLNFFTDTIDKKQFLRYDNSFIIASPLLYGDIFLAPGIPIADVTLQLSAKVLTEKRQYLQLIDVLGDVGGLMEILFTLLNLISSFVTEVLYDKALVNSLFTFDLNKKYVIFNASKYRKKVLLSINSFKDLNKVDTINLKQKFDELESNKNNNVEIFSKEKSNEPISLPKNTMNMTTSRNKLVKRRRNNIKNNSKNNSDNNNNNNNNNITIKTNYSRSSLLKNKSNTNLPGEKTIKAENRVSFHENNEDDIAIYNMDNEQNKNKKSSVSKKVTTEQDLKNVYISNFLICCFSCTTMEKNMNKILLREGSKILTERLDIVNMFYYLYTIETIRKKLKIEAKGVDMSDNCLNNLQIYNNYIKSKNNDE
jgi:hypothetical protein